MIKECNQLNSIKILKEEVEKIDNLLTGLLVSSKYLKKITDTPSFEKFMVKEFNDLEEAKNIFIPNKERENQIFELCFIRLYASFESFMTDLLRELYKKHPKSLPRDKKISVDDILDWKDQKSTRYFIIDSISIENSYDLNVWLKMLKNTFGIKVFRNTKEEENFKLINLMRNMILHSGRKFNSKISRDASKFMGDVEKNDDDNLFEVTEFPIKDYLLYDSLNQMILMIIENIENKNE